MRTVSVTVALAAATIAVPNACDAQPIRVGFLWHMHQPVYYPGTSIFGSEAFYSFSVVDVHNQRFGPYTTWPSDAVNAGSFLPHLGSQVSFSGTLIGNLNQLETNNVNGGMWSNWDGAYRSAAALDTSLGNPRLDLVAFGHFHPLMPLLDTEDIRKQIQLHKHIYAQTWNQPYSNGMFPPETAFSTNIIPALVAEGIDWVLVDNIHFDRACQGYPYTPSSNLYPPNRADQINPDPALNGGAWVQLNNLWAPSRVSAPFGYQPHYAQHVDPTTGTTTQIIVVPAARYEGNEDGRGGYGAFLYDQVMDQYLQYNNDPAHPMFVVLHHDGDNFGGGSESYYHHNFSNMVNWVNGDPDYEVTTIQDYVERFPPASGDVIHVEPGSWAGADNGDPEFKKWLGDPNGSGVSPDINSWAVLTAAKNRVFTAEAIAPATNTGNMVSGVGSSTERAWHFLLMAEASDYWYWDFSGDPWDGNVTRASNLATAQANAVVNGAAPSADTVGPTIFLPQREPYNPGGFEWGAAPEPSDFEVWTLVDDLAGLQSVTLYYRVDADGDNPIASTQNETFAGGSEVGAWQSVAMTSSTVPTPSGVPSASHKAQRFGGMITGLSDVLVDYYVQAIDTRGNTTNSPIQHVYVGDTTIGGGDAVAIDPDPAMAGATVDITYDPSGGPLSSAGLVYIHYGFNGWSNVVSPDPLMTFDSQEDVWTITVNVPSSASQLSMVFNDGAGTWDNNNGQDWHFDVTGTAGPAFVIDGVLDAAATEVADGSTLTLWAGYDDGVFYAATQDAGEGNDHFIHLALQPGTMTNAHWAKSGQIAQWDAFLADENDNDFNGWFDDDGASESATGPNGGVLEGTLDLVGEFGAIPDSVYIVASSYQNFDGGLLVTQTPASGNNGNIEANEYLEVELCSLTPEGCCAPDVTGDGSVTVDDLLAFLAGWFQSDGDYDNSGATTIDDLLAFLSDWFAGC